MIQSFSWPHWRKNVCLDLYAKVVMERVIEKRESLIIKHLSDKVGNKLFLKHLNEKALDIFGPFIRKCWNSQNHNLKKQLMDCMVSLFEKE